MTSQSIYEYGDAKPASRLFANRPNLVWWLSVAALAVASGSVYLFKLASVQRSEYYAAIAHSMSMSFSNFFFGAIDPAGTITLDKIPGSYWVPAIFVKLFGFSTWSITAPNALATAALVVVVAITGRRIAPKWGLIAGALIATTPIIAAVARSNQPQTFFLLMLALAFDRAVVALQTGTRKQLIFAGLWIAAAFQMYMIEAWAVWPALIIAWFFVAKRDWVKKVVDLAIAGSISLVASLSWILIVSTIPAGSRPYIGSTLHNSAWEMVFGYNALGRFGSSSATTGGFGAATAASTATDYKSFTPPFSGSASILRLFNTQLAGQIAWLIVPTLLAIAFLIVLKKFDTVAIFLTAAFVVFYAMFAVVAGMHQFYTSALAISMALLITLFIGRAVDSNSLWMLPSFAGVAAVWSLVVASMYSNYQFWAAIVGLVLGVGTVVFWLLKRGSFASAPRLLATLVAALSLTTVFVPAVWAIDTVNHTNAINPVAGSGENAMGAGPGGMGAQGGFGAFGGKGGFGSGNFGGHKPDNGPDQFGQPPAGGKTFFGGHGPGQPDQAGQQPGGTFGQGGFGGGAPGGLSDVSATQAVTLINYLKPKVGNAKYVLAVFGAQASAPIINATGASVMPIGGFDGSDEAPTLDEFKALVASGDVKYVQMANDSKDAANAITGTNVTAQIRKWVANNCVVDSAAPGNRPIFVCGTN